MEHRGYPLMRVLRIVLAALVAVGACGGAVAQVPDKLNYQGRLTDPGGTPVTASVPMVFRLYTVGSGGAAIYTETQTVSVANGIFNVAIGSVTPLNLPFDVPYFLGVTAGADAEMIPRQAVLSGAYAQRADTANMLAASATVGGAQITGSISVATLPAVQLTGTIGTAQIANNAVTQAKLSTSGTNRQILSTDGTNLVWVTEPTISRWSGQIGSIPGASGVFVFAGPTTSVVVPSSTRRITATASGAMAVPAGVANAEVNICYQPAAGAVNEFQFGTYLAVTFTTTRIIYTASDSVVLGAGTFDVGLCVRNTSATAITSNDWSKGWAMVTLN